MHWLQSPVLSLRCSLNLRRFTWPSSSWGPDSRLVNLPGCLQRCSPARAVVAQREAGPRWCEPRRVPGSSQVKLGNLTLARPLPCKPHSHGLAQARADSSSWRRERLVCVTRLANNYLTKREHECLHILSFWALACAGTSVRPNPPEPKPRT